MIQLSEKEIIINQLFIDIKESRNTLTIKDIAKILGNIFDDTELEVLIKEIKNITINI